MMMVGETLKENASKCKFIDFISSLVSLWLIASYFTKQCYSRLKWTWEEEKKEMLTDTPWQIVKMCSCVQLLLPVMVEFMLNKPQGGSRKSSGWRHCRLSARTGRDTRFLRTSLPTVDRSRDVAESEAARDPFLRPAHGARFALMCNSITPEAAIFYEHKWRLCCSTWKAERGGGSSGWGVCVRVLVNADERRGSSVQSVGRVWLRGVSRSGVAAQTRGRPGPLCKKEAMWNQASLMGNESLHHGQSRLRGPDIITFPRRVCVLTQSRISPPSANHSILPNESRSADGYCFLLWG